MEGQSLAVLVSIKYTEKEDFILNIISMHDQIDSMTINILVDVRNKQ